eukprot:7388443-Prymnesium_polylepis.1
MLKPPCSNSSAPHRKPPWRTRLATSGATPCRSSAACSTSHRVGGITRSRSRPQWLIVCSAGTVVTPSGRAALRPATSTLVPPATSTASPLTAFAMTGRLPCRCSASCLAVGWSNTSVLDSDAPLPAAACSWLRSSTAPRESTPASISGASASTELPAVRRTISSTSSRSTAFTNAVQHAAAAAA